MPAHLARRCTCRTASLLTAAFVAAIGAAPAAATDITVPLSADAVWTPAGNPYAVTVGYPTVLVPEGVTLTLLPGVEVRANVTIVIAGTLIAEGDAGARITVDELTPGQRFGGLSLKRLSAGAPVHEHRLRHVDILRLAGEIAVDRHGLVMSHCTVAATGSGRRVVSSYGGVSSTFAQATVSITDSELSLTSNHSGSGWTPTTVAAIYLDGHDAVVSRTTITVTTTGTFVSAAAIFATDTNTGSSVVTTTGNTIAVSGTSDDTPTVYGIAYDAFTVSGAIDDNVLTSVTGPEHVYGIKTTMSSRVAGNDVTVRSSSPGMYADVSGIHFTSTNPDAEIVGNRVDVSSDSQWRSLRGLFVQAGTVAHNRITGRHDGPSGGITAIVHQYYPATIVHNTIVLGPCGVVACRGVSTGNTGGDVLVRNNILVGPGDGASIGLHSYTSPPATVTADFNLFHGWGANLQDASSGGGDVFADPRFADAALHLAIDSPAVDAGHWNSLFADEPAPNGGRADLGAFGNTAGATASVAIGAPEITTNGGLDFSTAATTVVIEGLTSAATTALRVNGSSSGVAYTPGTTTWRYDGPLVHGMSPVVVVAMRGPDASAPDTIAVRATWPPTVAGVSPASGAEDGGTVITITGANFVPGATAVRVGGVAATGITVESPTTVRAVTPPGPVAGPVDVQITTADGTATRTGAFTYHQLRYFAEGAANALFDQRLALANPTLRDASVHLRFLTSTGTTIPFDLVVAAMTRRTIDASDVPSLVPAEFSTVIESDAAIVVDRTVTWADGTHAERAVTAAAQTWYLAEGATHSGFDLFYLLQNPSAMPATVAVTYLLPSGSPLTKSYTVAPRSRQNIWVNHEEIPAGSGHQPLGSTDVSATFVSDQPIIVERALYLSAPGASFLAGHESAGVTAPALEWFLAEGATGDYFDLFLLLANPDTRTADVTLQFLLPDGTVIARTYEVAPQSRHNIWVDYEDPRLASTAVSSTVTVTNGVGIIVERALWWPGTPATWHEAHNSPGSTLAGTAWALAEGENGGPDALETYVLVANTADRPATVEMTALFEAAPPITRRFTVPPHARFNISVVEFPELAERRYGAVVESIGTDPAAIVVERAMYRTCGDRPWGGGSNALATRLR